MLDAKAERDDVLLASSSGRRLFFGLAHWPLATGRSVVSIVIRSTSTLHKVRWSTQSAETLPASRAAPTELQTCNGSRVAGSGPMSKHTKPYLLRIPRPAPAWVKGGTAGQTPASHTFHGMPEGEEV